MNLNLLQLVSKYITLLTVSCMSFFGINNYNEDNITVSNENINKDVTVVNTVTDYDTVIEYNSKLPSNVTNVLQEGNIGLSFEEETKNNIENKPQTVMVQEASSEIIEKGTGDYGIYVGKMVGYSYDCQGCSTEGYLACKTADNNKFSLKYDGIYYQDKDFGQVRIVAAATQKFPCGTIINVTKSDSTSYNIIVLDSGGSVKKAWENGSVLMDLAYENNAAVGSDGLIGNNITFSVQRWGW